ncbi:hypothetical protein V6O07_15905, partial [Arthrospira platensis SPKY2]
MGEILRSDREAAGQTVRMRDPGVRQPLPTLAIESKGEHHPEIVVRGALEAVHGCQLSRLQTVQ